MSEEIEVVGFRYRSRGKHWELNDESVFSDKGDWKSAAEEQEMLMTVSQHKRIVEQKNQRIEHLESAWHADVIEGKDAAIAKQEAENDCLKAELEQYKRDAERMREALDEIVMPIKYMHQRIEDGCQLNGMAAIQMANDPEYLRQIAKQALSAQPAQGCGACGDACEGKQCRVEAENPPAIAKQQAEGAAECGCRVESDEKFGSLIYTCPQHDNSVASQQAEVKP